jgi:hypothetical protein
MHARSKTTLHVSQLITVVEDLVVCEALLKIPPTYRFTCTEFEKVDIGDKEEIEKEDND